MRTIVLILFLLFSSQLAYADEVGRYQAVPISKVSEMEADKVLLIDTKEGHIWIWVEQTAIAGARQGARFLRYQGKLKPGKKIGEIVEKQEWQN